MAALKPLISTEGPTSAPDMAIASPAGRQHHADPVAGGAERPRAESAVQQSIEIVRRRIDETGVVDPQITQQGNDRIVVQLARHQRSRPDQGVARQDRAHDVPAGGRDAPTPPPAAPPPPGDDFLPMQDNPGEKIAVRKRVDVDGGDLTDARAGTNPQTGEWVVNFTFNSVGARRFADITRANVNHRFAIVLDGKVISRAGDPRADHRRPRRDQRHLHRHPRPPTWRCCCAPARCRRR